VRVNPLHDVSGEYRGSLLLQHVLAISHSFASALVAHSPPMLVASTCPLMLIVTLFSSDWPQTKLHKHYIASACLQSTMVIKPE
jgi:hypothetical protein